MEKFQIYLKDRPGGDVTTLSISRIDTTTNTYKLKVVKEGYNSKTNSYEKNKINEFHIGADEVVDKIKRIDFKKDSNTTNIEERYCEITLDGKKIISNDVESLKTYLDMFDFLDIVQISKNEYKNIKDLQEYLVLRKMLIEKCKGLEGEKVEIIINKLVENPYDVFENFGFFDKYIESI